MRAGVMRMDQISPGELGGMFAGAVGALAVLGKGLAWLLNWDGARKNDREGRLAAWEKSLVDREKAYREEIEERLDQVQKDLAEAKGLAEILNRNVSTLVIAVGDLASELEAHAPQALSLIRARTLLESLKITPTPVGLATLARKIDAANTDASSH